MFVGAGQFLVGMLLAESLYPGYSISGNYISDLGAFCNGVFPNAGVCVIYQPTSNIFNTSVFLLGVLLVAAAYVFWRPHKVKVFSVLVLLTGIGAMGVAVFPETNPIAHEITSDVAFLFAGLSAIWGYRLAKAPMSYFSVILGVVNLLAIVLFTANVLFGLGVGGMERMIVYPVVIWAIGIGGYFMNSDMGTELTSPRPAT
jgi:hypothetical membrane protein